MLFVSLPLAAALITFIVLDVLYFSFIFVYRLLLKVVYFLLTYMLLRLGANVTALIIAKNGIWWGLAFAYNFLSTWPILFLVFLTCCFLFTTHETPIYDEDDKAVYLIDENRATRIFRLKCLFMAVSFTAVILIVVGAAIIAGHPLEDLHNHSLWTASKGIRIAGNLVFLFIVVCILAVTVGRYPVYRDTPYAFSFMTTMVCCLLLIISLVHNILAVVVTRIDYYNPASIKLFVKYEYPMLVAMEWVVAVLALYLYCCIKAEEYITVD